MTTMRNKPGVVRKELLLTLLANVGDEAYIGVADATHLSVGHLAGLDYVEDRRISLTNEVIVAGGKQ